MATSSNESEAEPLEEIQSLTNQQKRYILEHEDLIRSLPHPDEVWTIFDTEIEMKTANDLVQMNAVEVDGTEQTGLGEFRQFRVSWPAYNLVN